MEHKFYMERCLQLAENGTATTSPNPMVGCVITHEGVIIGEGWHRKTGEPHAEVNAINSVSDKELLKNSTLYVNLEPCSHYGKTPPCAHLIVEKQIPRVVIACRDSSAKVNGKGVEVLRSAGIEVIEGVLQKEAELLNRRFFTFHRQKRPYIILKWAQTLDGYIDKKRQNTEKGVNWITDPYTKALVHQWRAREDAILVGTQTVLNDNPALTVREIKGKDPIRLIIDRDLKIPNTANIFKDNNVMVFHHQKHPSPSKNFTPLDFQKELIPQILAFCHSKNIQSVFVEGGAATIGHFIRLNLWDEARVLMGNLTFGNGLKAPEIRQDAHSVESFGKDLLLSYYNS